MVKSVLAITKRVTGCMVLALVPGAGLRCHVIDMNDVVLRSEVVQRTCTI